MNKDILNSTVKHLLEKGKGILAADETPTNIGQKFASLHIENTSDNRRKYREMLFSAPNMESYISGVILQDETIHQFASCGLEFGPYLQEKGLRAGIKVDLGLGPFRNGVVETITKGLEGLYDRLSAYKNFGASFAKWRAVIHINPSDQLPTAEAIEANANILAEYAYKCQKSDVVPIVEPEVLMNGNHYINVSYDVTKRTLTAVFNALKDQGVYLGGMLLKPNMVISGLMCPNQASPEDVAAKTLACFKETVPAEVPGIVFLSGGQRDELAIKHLELMNQSAEQLPWVLSFSYGRALQRQALTAWKGDDQNITAAQKAFMEQARLNSLATFGKSA